MLKIVIMSKTKWQDESVCGKNFIQKMNSSKSNIELLAFGKYLIAFEAFLIYNNFRKNK